MDIMMNSDLYLTFYFFWKNTFFKKYLYLATLMVIQPWSYSAKSLAYPQDSWFGAFASLAFLDCLQVRSHLTLTKDINLCFSQKLVVKNIKRSGIWHSCFLQILLLAYSIYISNYLSLWIVTQKWRSTDLCNSHLVPIKKIL